MRPHEINELNTFVKGWYIDESVCDTILSWFDNSNQKYTGQCFSDNGGKSMAVDKSVKDSTDCILDELFIRREYTNELQKVINQYVDSYHYSGNGQPFAVTEPIVVQHYNPGGGYYAWHYERSHAWCEQANRHLVFTTYLNDVEDDGETEFYYQKLKVKPKKGLTVIFPADWTHTHRGVASQTEEKYIVTGWLNYQ